MLLQDIRFALRQIIRNPGFSFAAILSLTLGIGSTVAVYSVLYDAVLHPWPYRDVDRICDAWIIDKAGNERILGLTGPQVRQLRQTHAVDDVIGIDWWDLTVTGSDVPENSSTVFFTGNGFEFFGVPAMLGRYFTRSDAPDGVEPPPVAVLSYQFWQRHFGGDYKIIGRTIQLAHKSYTILGVMPPRFTWMDGDVYLPLNMATDQVHRFGTKIKLRRGVSVAAAEAEFRPLFQDFDRQTPNVFPQGFRMNVRGFADAYVQSLRKTMYLLFGAVALLLAIGCANVSILLLARGTEREHEVAVRLAVGASRFRIVRLLLTESLLLSVTGSALGVLLAFQAIRLIVSQLPDRSFPHEADFHINFAVLFFSVGLAILSGILFGLFPSLQSVRPQISQVMQQGAKRSTGGLKKKRLHTFLIAGQIALTLSIMSAAGIAIQGFVRLNQVPLGYDPRHVMSLAVPIDEHSHTSWDDRSQFFGQLREQVASVPGVIAAGIATNAVPPNAGMAVPVRILGKTDADLQVAHAEFVSPEYFSTLAIPLVAGRVWEGSEIARGAPLVLINEAFARRYLSAHQALGRSVQIPDLTDQPPYRVGSKGSNGWLQIIGIVGDSINDGLEKPVAPAVYAPYTLMTWTRTQLVVRTQGDPLTILHSIRRQIASIAPDQQIAGEVKSLEGQIQLEPEYARSRLISLLFGAFSMLALALAAIGLYSVVSYSVAQRTDELGIRIALGARRRDLMAIVLSSAGLSVGLGIIAGLICSLASKRLMTIWIDSKIDDAIMTGSAALLLVTVATLACMVPLYRALAIQPMSALRAEKN